MKTLSNVLTWADELLSSVVLGTLGGLLAAATYSAILSQANVFYFLAGLSLSAYAAAMKIRL